MCHKLAQSTSLPASIESGVSSKNSLVPNSATLYKIELSKCYGVLPTVIPSASHDYDGDCGSTFASLLCCKPLVAPPELLQPHSPDSSDSFHANPSAHKPFPPDVTSYSHSLAPTSTLSSLCSWHRLSHQSPMPQGLHLQSTYKTTFCLVFLDFVNCETICYLMWMEVLIFLG